MPPTGHCGRVWAIDHLATLGATGYEAGGGGFLPVGAGEASV